MREISVDGVRVGPVHDAHRASNVFVTARETPAIGAARGKQRVDPSA